MSSKKDLASSRLVSKKEKIFNWIIFVLLLLGAVVMVFPLIYMIATSFMTKNQILSGTLTILPDPTRYPQRSQNPPGHLCRHEAEP